MTAIVKKIKSYTRAKIHGLGRFFGIDMMYIFKSGFWINGNYLFTSVCGLITSVLFAHFVSKDTYGTYQYILAIAGIVATFTPNNMNSAVIRAVAQGYEGDFVTATKYQIKYGVIASVIALGISVWYLFHNGSGIALSVLFIALFLPTANALNTWGAYTQGKKAFERNFYYNLLNTVISYAAVISMLYFTRNFVWIAFGNIFFGFVGNLIIYELTVRQMQPNKATNPETIPYGVHLSIIGIPTGLVGQLDALLVFHFIGPAALAIYSFATLMPEKLTGGLKFISSIAFPRFAEKDETTVKDFLKKKLWLLIIFILICAGLYALVVPWIFAVLFPSYMASVPYTQVYGLSFFSIASSVVQAALTSQRKIKALYISNLGLQFIKALLLIVLMYYFSIWGIIWAQIISNILSIIMQLSLFNGNKKAVAV